MYGWLQDLWLVAIFEDVPPDEVGRWWTGKDTALLDGLVESAPAFRLGTILTTLEASEPDGPTRRLFDVMFLRGTCPEDFDQNISAPYVLPLLNADLRAVLLAAFLPKPDDHLLMEAAPPSGLADFLQRHESARLATHCRAEAIRICVN